MDITGYQLRPFSETPVPECQSNTHDLIYSYVTEHVFHEAPEFNDVHGLILQSAC